MGKRKVEEFIFVCTGKDCKKRGSKKLRKAIALHLKAQEQDNKVDVINMKCTGNCNEGPVVILKNRMITRAKQKEVINKIGKP